MKQIAKDLLITIGGIGSGVAYAVVLSRTPRNPFLRFLFWIGGTVGGFTICVVASDKAEEIMMRHEERARK